MNDAPGAVMDALQVQTQALLDLIEADRARQCAQVLGEAHARAAAVRAQAQAEARRRLRQAFLDERARLHERLAAAQARLATQRRLHAQRRTAALLQLARAALPGALAARWQDAAARAAWVAAVLAAARARMPRGAWRIVHPPAWPDAERQACGAAVKPIADAAPQFDADASVAAGLKIVRGGNVIDGSIAGLLADRADIEARLLRHLEAAP